MHNYRSFPALVCLMTLLLCQQNQSFAGIGDVERAPDADIVLLTKLDRALEAGKADTVAVVLEDLLRRSRSTLKNLAVPSGFSKKSDEEEDETLNFRGFRSLVLSRLEQLPTKYRKIVQQGHDAAVRGLLKGRPDGDMTKAIMLEIVESYPLSAKAFEAAEQLAQLAFEEDDLVAAQHYDIFMSRLHRFKKRGWSSYVRRILVASRLGQSKRSRSLMRIFAKKAKKSGRADLLSLVERTEAALKHIQEHSQPQRVVQLKLPLRVHPYNEKQRNRLLIEKPKSTESVRKLSDRERRLQLLRRPRSAPQPPSFMPLVRGHQVFVSNGRRVFVYDSRNGKRQALLPFDLDTKLPASPVRGQTLELVEYGSLLLAHLMLDQNGAVVSEERSPESVDSQKILGSLLIFDRDRQNRVVFWEGDRGPTGTSRFINGSSDKSAGERSISEVLTRGQIVGRPAICGQRIYSALVVHDSEAEVWLAAFERQPREGGDLGVGLKLCWLTRLTSNTIKDVKDGFRIFPAVYLSRDKVYCHNGNATIAAVRALDGQLEWVAHTGIPEPVVVRRNPFRSRVSAKVPAQTREPIHFVKRGTLSDVVLFSPPGSDQVFAYDSANGKLIWATNRSQIKAKRFFVTEDGLVIRYGHRTLIAIDGRSGKLCSYPVSREDTRNYSYLPSTDNVQMSGDYHNGIIALPAGQGWARIVRATPEYDKDGRNPIVKFKVGPRIKLIGTKDDGHLRMTPTGFAYTTKYEIWLFGPRSENDRLGRRDGLKPNSPKAKKSSSETETGTKPEKKPVSKKTKEPKPEAKKPKKKAPKKITGEAKVIIVPEAPKKP